MRRDEIASLTWQQVDMERCTLLLPKTKNGEARTVPLSPAALAILKEIPQPENGDEHHGQRVFSYTISSITGVMRENCAKAGIKDLRFHDLRHEAISRLFENTDLDVMEIRMITGHKTLQMLARYTHLRAERLVKRLAGKKR
ncbi:site-specific integrase [Desulfovibrio porci]|uniref:site-specific integrase n=1 Tax=Desulfovibrio porci TaxID=2605782 RepID=UPI001E34CFBD|nr:site-specific integrase [Desulfovibrio porci]MDY3808759.1 site-specific integrase [Desulfovibrio porci]